MIDSINKCPYRVETLNALELSNILKDTYNELSIDYTKYIVKNYISEKPTITPKEIYEYQNFFLLLKDNKYILLDGFRRLLWYDVPNTDVQVRIYNYNDMINSQVLQLLFNLNHQKLYQTGSNNFFDRGFALFLKTVWGLNLFEFKLNFLGYLNQTNVDKNYGSEQLQFEKSNQLITQRITNENFINDMRFLKDCTDLLKLNEYSFGALIASYREKFNDKFGQNEYVQIIKELQNNGLILKQIEKFNNAKDSRNIGYWNDLLPMLTNILNKVILGSNEAKMTMVEKMVDYKNILGTYKKDKSFEYLGGVLNPDDHKVLVGKYAGKPKKCAVIVEPQNVDDEIVQEMQFYYSQQKGSIDNNIFYTVRFGIKNTDGKLYKKVIESVTRSGYYSSVKKTFGKYPMINKNGYEMNVKCDVFIKLL